MSVEALPATAAHAVPAGKLPRGVQLGLLVVALAAAAAAVGYLLAARAGAAAPMAGSLAVPAAGAAGRAAALASAPAFTASNEQPAAAAQPGSQADALRWPLWAFRLQDPVPAREPPLTPVSWRLLGAALFDGRWHAIVQRQGAAQPDYYKTGDKLPGGYLIKEITQEDLTLRAGRREIVLSYIGSR